MMPTEDDLRDLFASEPVTHSIDPQRVVARSRARRIPRQIGAATIGTLAIAGISVLGVQTIAQQQTASDSAITMQESYDAPESGTGLSQDSDLKRAPASAFNLCEAPLAEVAPTTDRLQLELDFPNVASTGTEQIIGTVRLTNVGDSAATGEFGDAALVLSQDGVVLWHTNGAQAAVLVSFALEPGQSTELPIAFLPVRCSVEDDSALYGFRPDLPPVEPGEYQLSFLQDVNFTDFADEQLTPDQDLITADPITITLQ